MGIDLDPLAGLDALAGEARRVAAALHGEADDLRRLVDAVPWGGRAAEAFRAAAAHHLGLLGDVADGALAAAAMLEEHAARTHRHRADLLHAAGGVVGAVAVAGGGAVAGAVTLAEAAS